MELKNLIIKMVNEEDGYSLSRLVTAVKQIPVLAIRKYSYEHAFAYFRETLQYSEQEFDYWCDQWKTLYKDLQMYSTAQSKW